ncbi:MAG: glycosyltransferase family 9 protein [Bacteroidetes bacterium]|nr:glycosyltransferase family 9 protein [Bacteroidota bacterium]
MEKILIIKLGASGDVVRTTTLLHILNGEIHWLTGDMNAMLLQGIPKIKKIITPSELAETSFGEYDLVINLEDDVESSMLLSGIKTKEIFGAYLGKDQKVHYTESSKEWFDLSLISTHGIKKANQLKFENKKSYQEMIFSGLGYTFAGESYLLPESPKTDLRGDIAVAPKAGKVWPMKNWAYFNLLVKHLRSEGLSVNILPERPTMLEHLADVRNHEVLISGDSLPMHFALGSEIPLVTLFICTSAAEIYDYNLMTKIVSPDLQKYWYRRDFDEKATKSIPFDEVLYSVSKILERRLVHAH